MSSEEQDLLNEIKRLLTLDEPDVTSMIKLGNMLSRGKYAELNLKLVKQEVEREFEHSIMGSDDNSLLKLDYVQLLTLLEQIPENFIRFVELIRTENLDRATRYNVWAQARGMMFIMPTLYSKEAYKHYLDAYLSIVNQYKSELNINLKKIPYENRNHDLVLILTQNFLSGLHGPTKSCFYRASALKQVANKDVFIINTNDVAPYMKSLPLFWEFIQNEVKGLNDIDFVTDGENRFSFFQAVNEGTINENAVMVILETIAELKPECIVNIGGFSPIASLANDMIPVMLVGLAPSQLQYDGTDFFAYSLEVTDEVYSFANYLGANRNSLIPSVFTSDLKPQSEHHTRKELGIPEGETVGCVIGGRLDLEIDDEFIEFLLGLDNSFIIFMGKYDKYEESCSKYGELRERSKFLGMVDDILSHIELCDIYINPRRHGGGTSSVEAMSKGVVPVSIKFGDVAYNVGEEFVLDDYVQMRDRIVKLQNDRQYYEVMSQKAKDRAAYLCDTKHRFIDTYNEVVRRMQE